MSLSPSSSLDRCAVRNCLFDFGATFQLVSATFQHRHSHVGDHARVDYRTAESEAAQWIEILMPETKLPPRGDDDVKLDLQSFKAR
eukprot:SAG31_NODE_3429_length_4284_cov_7.544086_8_plen_86_part_00